MNWIKIRDNNKSSFKVFADWLYKDSPTNDYQNTDRAINLVFTRMKFNLRNLYDFFDEQKIRIEIKIREHGTFSPSICVWENWKNNWEYNWLSKPKFTRAEAETEAFTSAFRILNDKLKNQ
jgi:hypothetical protein